MGEQAPAGSKFVVGGDVRHSTPGFLLALADGLCEAGLDVVIVGTLPTPLIHYARRRLAADGCAIVTASHCPPQFNGLKWMIGDHPPTEKDVRMMKRVAEGRLPKLNGRGRTKPRSVDVTFDYVAWLQERWMDAPIMRRSIVVDPMYGVWACRARRYLQAIFPHCVFSAIHDEPDASFGGRPPDCSSGDALADLAEAVYRQRALLGIAFDGDGDCVAFVDDEGVALLPDEATWLLLRSLEHQMEGKPFVYDVRFSQCVPEAARNLGAQPLPERCGPAFIHRRMRKSGAMFGAEASGHYFFHDLAGGDDGLFAACAMIAYLAASGKPLSALRRKIPKVCMTPELPLRVKARFRRDVVRMVCDRWSKYPTLKLDGVRIQFPNGGVLVRNSAAEPTITFRFEGRDWNGLTELVSNFCDALPEIGDALWAIYEEAMEVD